VETSLRSRWWLTLGTRSSSYPPGTRRRTLRPCSRSCAVSCRTSTSSSSTTARPTGRRRSPARVAPRCFRSGRTAACRRGSRPGTPARSSVDMPSADGLMPMVSIRRPSCGVCSGSSAQVRATWRSAPGSSAETATCPTGTSRRGSAGSEQGSCAARCASPSAVVQRRDERPVCRLGRRAARPGAAVHERRAGGRGPSEAARGGADGRRSAREHARPGRREVEAARKEGPFARRNGHRHLVGCKTRVAPPWLMEPLKALCGSWRCSATRGGAGAASTPSARLAWRRPSRSRKVRQRCS